MNDRALGPAEVVISISGAVMLVASFLDVYRDLNAWDEFLFPLFVLPVVVGAVMTAQVLIAGFGIAELPTRVLRLDWVRMHVALGAYAAVMMVSFLVGDPRSGRSLDRGAGFWLMLLSSIGLLAGALMMRAASATSASGGGTVDTS